MLAFNRTPTLLLSARPLVLGRDVDDAVGVNVKGDLNLRDAAGGRGDSHQSELTQHLVVCCHLPLSLTHLDLHLRLSVRRRGEHLQGDRGTPLHPEAAFTQTQNTHSPSLRVQYLALLGGDGGVPVDEFGEDSAQGLDTQRQGCDIQQQHIGDITGQNSTLDGCTYGDGLVRVDGLAGSAAEQVLNRLLNL